MTEMNRPDHTGPEGADDLNRLTAADPERGTPSPDLTDVRAHVMAKAADTPQRRKSMLLAAGVAAAVALLAGTTIAGVAIGRNSAPIVAASDATTQQTQANSVPMVGPGRSSANNPGAPQPGAPENSSGRNSMMGGGTAASGMASDKMAAIYPGWGYGNQIFTAADGVSTSSPGTATAYVISAEGVVRLALAKTLANTFGVKGQPVDDGYGNITVGSNDGTGPQIWVSNDALVSWSYYNPKFDPWANCAYASSAPSGPMASGSGATVDPIPPDAPSAVAGSTGSASSASSAGSSGSSDPVPTPSTACDQPTGPDADASQQQAEQILATLGVNKDDVEWETVIQGPTTNVSALQLVNGMRSQIAWNLTFSDKGVQSAYGNAAGVTAIEGYPVVSPKDAIDRANDPQWRAFGPTPDWGKVYPMASDVVAKDSNGSLSPSTPAPAPTKDGRPVVQVPLTTVTLSGGDAALVQYWQLDGTLLLLPGYRFTDADGGAWNVISIAESAVDFSTP
jgi:hypothetical protein